MSIRPLIFSAFLLLTVSTYATASGFPSKMGKISMDSYINLASPGSLLLVKRQGELIVFSGNGRYMIRGAIYDMWNGGKRIRSMSEGRKSSRRIRFNDMGKVLEDVASLDIGDQNGKQVIIFIDTDSPESMRLLQQIHGIKGYKFKIVIMAATGNKSAVKAKSLMCLIDKDRDAAVKALESGNLTFLQKGECGKEKLMRTLILAKMFGITRIPVIIAPNGEPFVGRIADIQSFLDRNQK